MARVSELCSAADTLWISKGAVIAGSSRSKSCAGITKSQTPSRIWLRSSPDNKSPTTDRSPVANRPSHRSWTSSFFLFQDLSHCAPFVFFVTGHGMGNVAHQRPDLQTTTHYYLESVLFTMLKGKKEAVWPEMVMRIGAKHNVTPLLPIGITRDDPNLISEIYTANEQ